MDNQARLIINGGKRLEGEIAVQGSKNSALPLLSASVLVHGESTFHNCPKLSDIDASCRILACLGCKCKRSGDTVTVDAGQISEYEIPDCLMRRMRGSVIFLGSVLGRTGRCRLSFPGGCEIGSRPIDLHLSALRQMGAVITEEHGYLDCETPAGLHGAKITLSFSSVGATENILLAAVLANGVTEIHNAAREPEIVDLADCLNKFGAKISGAGESTIYIEGVQRLEPNEHTVIPDRIVAGTYMCAAAITRGELILTHCEPSHMNGFIPVLEQMGVRVYPYGGGKIYLNSRKRLVAPSTVRTMPYPGFPTDVQAPFTALCSTAEGTSVFVETIFENRFRHVSELVRLGASVKVEGNVCVIEGVKKLSGAKLCASELRGGAALVVAGLSAEGVTEITGVNYIERGYETIENELRQIGADIKKVQLV